MHWILRLELCKRPYLLALTARHSAPLDGRVYRVGTNSLSALWARKARAIDGYQVARQIRRRQTQSGSAEFTPIITVTANAADGD